MPRWLVSSLIVTSVGFLLVVVGGWLVWPTITARQFVAATESGQFEKAKSMMVNGEWSRTHGSIHLKIRDTHGGIPTSFGWGVSNPTGSILRLTSDAVKLSDVLNGIRRLRLTHVEGRLSNLNEISFEAGFGHVGCDWSRVEGVVN